MKRRIMAVAVAVAVAAGCVFLCQGCSSCSEERRPAPQQKNDPPHKAAGNGGFQGGNPSDETGTPPPDK